MTERQHLVGVHSGGGGGGRGGGGGGGGWLGQIMPLTVLWATFVLPNTSTAAAAAAAGTAPSPAGLLAGLLAGTGALSTPPCSAAAALAAALAAVSVGHCVGVRRSGQEHPAPPRELCVGGHVWAGMCGWQECTCMSAQGSSWEGRCSGKEGACRSVWVREYRSIIGAPCLMLASVLASAGTLTRPASVSGLVRR